jgi:hypothetical protein
LLRIFPAVKSLVAAAALEASVFKVDVSSLKEFFSFDPTRKSDLQKLDALIRKTARTLTPHFHAGTPTGEAGMRMKMLGYGKSSYTTRAGKTTPWPVIGVALQKSYISVYFAVRRGGRPITERYVGKLGELKMGRNNFSFENFDDLNADALKALLLEAETIFAKDPIYQMRREARPAD